MAKSAHNFFHLALAALLAATPASGLAATKKNTPSKKPASTQRAATAKASPTPPKATPRPAAAMLADGHLELAAKGAIVIDAYTGQPLFEKNSDATYFPASTTKIMTALLVIEAGQLDRIVEITEEDAKVGESGLSIKAGERYTRRQMLFGLMLKSANDVAHALGRDNAGTMDAFTARMTLRAQELGARNTLFRNAHGLHDIEHYTNARDLAAITRAAMQQPFFREIVTTKAFTWERSEGPWPLTNHNRLLKEFPGCTGVKTGYTRPAQQVLASAAVRDGREVIAIVMHTDKPGIWEDSKLLLTYGLQYPPGAGPAMRETASAASAASGK
jgi:D-alanyl-D-alanine carboxypeptidase (penicillin-binding protein 5/6)